MLIYTNVVIMVMILDFLHVHNLNGQMVIGIKLLLFFGVDNSSYTHFDNKKRYLGEGPTQG